jgi:hypothetical protein
VVETNVVILYPPAGALGLDSAKLRSVGELLNNEALDEDIFGLARDRRLGPSNFEDPFAGIICDPNGIRVIVLEKPTASNLVPRVDPPQLAVIVGKPPRRTRSHDSRLCILREQTAAMVDSRWPSKDRQSGSIR